MADVVKSEISWDLPQVDGRRNIRELHTIDDGSTRSFDYVCEANDDTAARMAEHADQLRSGFQYLEDNALQIAQAVADELQARVDDLSAQLDQAVAFVDQVAQSAQVGAGKLGR